MIVLQNSIDVFIDSTYKIYTYIIIILSMCTATKPRYQLHYLYEEQPNNKKKKSQLGICYTFHIRNRSFSKVKKTFILLDPVTACLFEKIPKCIQSSFNG